MEVDLLYIIIEKKMHISMSQNYQGMEISDLNILEIRVNMNCISKD